MSRGRVKKLVCMGCALASLGLGQLPTIQASDRIPGKLVTANYVPGSIDNFRIDSVDPEWVDGDFINLFLEQYPSSRLRGYGHLIKQLADKHGVSVIAYLGQIGLETTFGSANCGGPYNFGCYMWAPWMGVEKVGPSTGHTQFDRDWANPPSVARGIEIQMELVRNFYINRGLIYYADYLEVYSPSFENDHNNFKSIMWGVMQSFGGNPAETRIKVPGGMSNNIQLPTFETSVYRGQELGIDYFAQEYGKINQVERVEFLQHVDTENLGDQVINLIVFFKDNTFSVVDATVHVLPKTIEVGVKLPDGQIVGEQTIKEGEDWQVDVTGVLPANQTYGVLANDLERVAYQKVQGVKTYPWEESNTAKTQEEDGRVILHLPKTLSQGIHDLINLETSVSSDQALKILEKVVGGANDEEIKVD